MGSMTLIRRPREDLRSKTGLGRYSDSIEKLLQDRLVAYDVIEASLNLKNGYLKAVLNGFIRPGIKAVRNLRDKSGVVHATDELCGFMLPFVSGYRIVTVHHVIKPGEDRSKAYYHLWNFITKCALNHCEEIVVVSPDTGDDVRRAFDPKVPISVVYNPVMPGCVHDPYIPREKVIGIVAELIPRKNVSASLDVFNILSKMDGMQDYVLEICGKGMCRVDLDKMIQKLGLERKVIFHEAMSDQEVIDFYNRMVVLLNTSLHEGMGMVTVEANLCGTPTFHLKRADIPSRVLEASIPCDDSRDMAEKVFRLVNDDVAYARKSSECIEKASSLGLDFSRIMSEIYHLD